MGTFDAILMDIMMPVMDGLTATKAIRALNRPDAGIIPIIAMTANAFAEDVQRCLDSGMNAHLAKPLDIEKVKKTICEHTIELYNEGADIFLDYLSDQSREYETFSVK